jgi:Uncharacterized conserved protein
MKRHARCTFLLFLAVWFSLLRLGAISCGGASPPAGIPAPVSNLMSVSNPDGSGTVTVTGAPGAVNPGATVLGDNLSGGSSGLQSLLIRTAIAESTALSSTTIASTDGSFQLRLTASIGNSLRITQSVDKDTSLPTQVQVSGNVVALDAKPQGLGLDSLTHQAYVSGSQDSTGFVFSLPLNSVAPLQSSPPATFTLADKGGIGDVEVDEDMGKVFAVAPMENSFVRFPFSTEMSISDLTLSSPLDIDISQELNLAVIGLADSSISIALFDTLQEKFTCDYLIDAPGTAEHVATPLVKAELSKSGSLQVIAVSQYQNDVWVVSRVQFSDCPTGFAIAGQIILPPSALPQGIAVMQDGDLALVTDATANQVLLVDFNTQSIRAAVPVGLNPVGVAINPTNNHAYVVNSGDNSVTSIDLQTFTTQTHAGIGLNPTEIAIDAQLGLAVVLSSFDQTAVFFNTDF